MHQINERKTQWLSEEIMKVSQLIVCKMCFHQLSFPEKASNQDKRWLASNLEPKRSTPKTLRKLGFKQR